ncbi:hypothetical protein KQ51_01122 [Candidatus Izimaplasma bacterium HR1]|jgi:hypothetical protein|uniref:hypothetical protein n=1 Tax=Candidatus Izimoplasma sp. HR1 TaxID=1541959 RepID=UPI0004F5D2CD|nr:hypothetical protein KQ51_01122 [Candidatus Izimaplasma bacterium HR1]
MNFDAIIQIIMDNILVSVFVGVIVIFIIFRLIKTARMYLGAKSYVRKARRLDKKKFNGLNLVEKTAKRRKKNTNTFKKLRNRGKKWVRKYLTHKFDELPIITRYSRGKLFKRSKNRLIIIVKNEKKTIKKISTKRGMKQIIDISNKYECLDEVITFLHHLPEAILNEQEYDIFFGEEGMLLTYQIK